MDAFSLLRYWRSNGGSDTTPNANVTTSTAATTTIVTGVSTQTSDTGSDDNDNDHGPFFDLELSLQDENEKNENVEEDEDSDDGSDDIEDVNDLKFALVTSSSGDSTADDVNVSVSPSDDLFFKGGFIPVAVADADDSGVQTTTFGGTHSKPSPGASLRKSATKLRVMMLKLKKLKISETSSELKQEQQQQKDEQNNNNNSSIEEVPIVSLFKRHNSTSKTQKKLQNDVVEPQQQQQQTVSEDISVNSEEKKFSKEAMQRYLRKVKPLYVRVSKRYGEKLKFSGQLAIKQKLSPSTVTSPATEERNESPRVKEGNLEVSEPPLLSSNGKGLRQGNLPAGLRVVCKHLGKSRSASTAVVAAAPPGMMSSKRRDDSLLQQQDGIQSAILHCKRSFKASRDSDCSSSESAPANEKCGSGSISDTAAEVRETTVEDENEEKLKGVKKGGK